MAMHMVTVNIHAQILFFKGNRPMMNIITHIDAKNEIEFVTK